MALFSAYSAGGGHVHRAELRLPVNPWPGYEFLYLAKEKGFLAKENLNVRKQD